ncbi:MAG: glycerol-3-phosphate responsive antiterminator [Spirochaetales bacterium]|nr:glycerol-3-phosphate responsive antiterminator [Spirochaetales bacterium]
MLCSSVIPALRRLEDIHYLADSPADTVFLMFGELYRLDDIVRNVKLQGKKVFLHTDLIKGLNQDKDAIRFIAEKIRPEGIVTTKSFVIKQAKACGLKAVHHLFLIDTNAFESGIRNVNASKPDAVEIMPGLMPSVIRQFKEKVDYPLLVGGLVKREEEMHALWEAGAHSVIAGAPELWNVEKSRIRRIV